MVEVLMMNSEGLWVAGAGAGAVAGRALVVVSGTWHGAGIVYVIYTIHATILRTAPVLGEHAAEWWTRPITERGGAKEPGLTKLQHMIGLLVV